MEKRRWLRAFLASTAMLGLILDGRTALAGAAVGLGLCLKTVVPALFPFFVCSILLTDALWGSRNRLTAALGRLFRLPEGAESVLIPAFLGGYPAGAQCVARAYGRGQLHREDARRMLGYCSNPGPSFLFGIVAPQLPRRWMAWALWGLLLLGALTAARLLPGSPHRASVDRRKASSLSEAMETALKVMASICGWVVLFRVALAFLRKLLPLPTAAGVLTEGLLELTNGCCSLARVEDEKIRFLLAGVMLSLGGACVTMQTVSVSQGLPLEGYFLGKAIQCLCFAVFSALLFRGNWWLIPVLVTISFFVPGKREKGVAISP